MSVHGERERRVAVTSITGPDRAPAPTYAPRSVSGPARRARPPTHAEQPLSDSRFHICDEQLHVDLASPEGRTTLTGATMIGCPDRCQTVAIHTAGSPRTFWAGRRQFRSTVRSLRPRLNQIVVDSREPAALVRFWAALLGGEPVHRARNWSHVEPPGFPKLSFQPVPEAKTAKNRLHLDLQVHPCDLHAAVAEAVELGATRVGRLVTDDQGTFQVMIDPEGNELCFVSD